MRLSIPSLCEMTNAVFIPSRHHFISRERNPKRIKASTICHRPKQQGLTRGRSSFWVRFRLGKSKSLRPLGSKSMCISDGPSRSCCLRNQTEEIQSFMMDHEQSKQTAKKGRRKFTVLCRKNKQSRDWQSQGGTYKRKRNPQNDFK